MLYSDKNSVAWYLLGSNSCFAVGSFLFSKKKSACGFTATFLEIVLQTLYWSFLEENGDIPSYKGISSNWFLRYWIFKARTWNAKWKKYQYR